MGDTSLINLGELSKPATVLIEKVSEAVGGIAKPWQMRRVAKAEAEAEVIKAHARIQISELEERALVRMVREEGRRQENIETITERAAANLTDSAKPEQIENDWLVHFFDKCRLISDADMQSLWANILSGQANTPGRFSKRTVELVSNLDKQDAELFTRFCTFAWVVGEPSPLIFDVNDESLNTALINFSAINHLSNIGLITFETLSGYQRKGFGKVTLASYFGKAVVIEFSSESGNSIQLGKCLFTKAGQQLFAVCGAQPSDEFFQKVVSKWSSEGLKVHVLPVQVVGNSRS